MKQKNLMDKYAVRVLKNDGAVICHLMKGATRRFVKTIFYPLRTRHENICTAIDISQPRRPEKNANSINIELFSTGNLHFN